MHALLTLVVALFSCAVGFAGGAAVASRTGKKQKDPEVHTLSRYFEFTHDLPNMYNSLSRIFELNPDKFEIIKMKLKRSYDGESSVWCVYKSYGNRWLIDIGSGDCPRIEIVRNPIAPNSVKKIV